MSARTAATRTDWTPIEAGDQVHGTYMGVPFSGQVDSTRGHTINWNLRLFHVSLDSPIDVYGSVRESICLTTLGDGGSYADHNGLSSDCTIRLT